MKNIFLKTNTGFTLVETLVAITIFTSAVVGLLNLTGGTISNINYAKNRIVATYLAIEGIEQMRNLRDTHVLFESNGWANFKSKIDKCDRVSNQYGCYINVDSLEFTDPTQPMRDAIVEPCGVSGCPYLLQDDKYSKFNVFNYSEGIVSPFQRTIHIVNVPNASPENKELKLTSIVSFKSGSLGTQQVSFTDYLKNWAE